MSFMRLLTAGRSWVGMQDATSRYRLTDPRSMPKFGGKKNPFGKRTEPERKQAGPAGAVVANEALQSSPAETVKDLRSREPQRNEESIGLVLSDSLRIKDALRLAEPQSLVDAVVGEGPEMSEAALEQVICSEPKCSTEAAMVAGPELESVRIGRAEAPEPESGEPQQHGRAASGSLKKQISSGLKKAGEQASAALKGMKTFGKKALRPFAARMPKHARAEAERRAIQTELSLDNVKVMRNDLADGDFEMVTAVPRRVRTSKPAMPRRQRAPEPEEQAALLAAGGPAEQAAESAK
jgi:hypothetical protein